MEKTPIRPPIEAYTEKDGTPYTGIAWVDTQTIAKIYGVTMRRIQQLVKEGVIESRKVYKDKKSYVRFDMADTARRLFDYDRSKDSKKRETESELKAKKLKADIALKELQKDYRRIQNSIQEGKYISLEQVKLEYSTFFVSFKKAMLNIPSRVAGIISGSVDATEARRIEKDISDEITDILIGFVVGGESDE